MGLDAYLLMSLPDFLQVPFYSVAGIENPLMKQFDNCKNAIRLLSRGFLWSVSFCLAASPRILKRNFVLRSC